MCIIPTSVAGITIPLATGADTCSALVREVFRFQGGVYNNHWIV